MGLVPDGPRRCTVGVRAVRRGQPGALHTNRATTASTVLACGGASRRTGAETHSSVHCVHTRALTFSPTVTSGSSCPRWRR